LIGAGLLLQSFHNLMSVDPGFRPENVLVGRLELPQSKYTTAAQIRSFYNQLEQRMRSLPGARSVGLVSQVPLNGHGGGFELVVEGQEKGPNDPVTVIFVRNTTPGYIESMGIPVLEGRTFQSTDTAASQLVAIVDEKTSKTFWPNENPIGKRIRTG